MIEKFFIAVYDSFIAPWFLPLVTIFKAGLIGSIIIAIISVFLLLKSSLKSKFIITAIIIIASLIIFGIIHLLELLVGAALSIGFIILVLFIIAIFLAFR